MPHAEIRAYEAVVVLRPTLDEDQIQAFLDRAAQAVHAKGGTVTAVERWGKRRLAYEIQHQREAHYVLLRFRAPSVGGISELDHLCRIHEDVLRHLIVLEQEGARAAPKPEPSKAEEPAAQAPSPAPAAAAEAGGGGADA